MLHWTIAHAQCLLLLFVSAGSSSDLLSVRLLLPLSFCYRRPALLSCHRMATSSIADYKLRIPNWLVASSDDNTHRPQRQMSDQGPIAQGKCLSALARGGECVLMRAILSVSYCSYMRSVVVLICAWFAMAFLARQGELYNHACQGTCASKWKARLICT